MIQIFIIGASSVYGVGGKSGGWADLIKKSLHRRMYGKNGIGEKYEVYNFGLSGAKIDFVQKTFPIQLQQYGRGGKTIVIISLGGNNAKAENLPENYVSTVKEFATQMSELLNLLKSLKTYAIVVGGGYYDESKTNPKHNPLTGGKSYFTNKRKVEFENGLKQLCDNMRIPFVEVTISQDIWKKDYLYKDGLHPNHKGHKYICNNVMKQLEKLL
ncbi:MAG: SGNH/GDSL hydrolase family protein [Patescibacteria group bacterium]